jgi:hypothetical protein
MAQVCPSPIATPRGRRTRPASLPVSKPTTTPESLPAVDVEAPIARHVGRDIPRGVEADIAGSIERRVGANVHGRVRHHVEGDVARRIGRRVCDGRIAGAIEAWDERNQRTGADRDRDAVPRIAAGLRGRTACRAAARREEEAHEARLLGHKLRGPLPHEGRPRRGPARGHPQAHREAALVRGHDGERKRQTQRTRPGGSRATRGWLLRARASRRAPSPGRRARAGRCQSARRAPSRAGSSRTTRAAPPPTTVSPRLASRSHCTARPPLEIRRKPPPRHPRRP